MARKTLHGIRKRPGARERLATLMGVRLRPAAHVRGAPLPERPGFHSTPWSPYVLVKRPQPREVAPFHSVEFDICRLYTGSTQKKMGRLYGNKCKLKPEHLDDDEDNWDLGVFLKKEYQAVHTSYHRVVGISLLQCHWDDRGRLLPFPYWVRSAAQLKTHVVHHVDEHRQNMATTNLAVVTVKCHNYLHRHPDVKLPRPRCGWGA